MDYILVAAVGLFAGFINTVAAGGSLITLPMMLFIGLEANIANATNRVAIFIQNIGSTLGFRSKGIKVTRFAVSMGISAFFGAIVGAYIGAKIDNESFKKVLAAIMVLFVLYLAFGKKYIEDKAVSLSGKSYGLSLVAFFFIGIYGGFIQAGTGMFIIAALTLINGMSLVRSNAVKVVVAFTYTIAALAVFIYHDLVDWGIGLSMSVGSVTGAWVGSRWSVGAGDKWVRRLLIIMVLVMALRLWFYA